MKKSSRDKVTYSPRLSKNRFEVLEEVQEVLGFSDMEWKGLFSLIRKTNGGMPSLFEFKFGDFGIDLFLDPHEKEVSFNIEKTVGARRKQWSYTYKLADLDLIGQLSARSAYERPHKIQVISSLR